MKLKGSRTEELFRRELERSHASVFNDPSRKRLLDALRSHAPDLKTAYVLDWIPEQGEDIYVALVDLKTIVTVELDRVAPGSEPIVSTTSPEEYERGAGRPGRIKLAVARQLAEADLKAPPAR